MKRHRSWTTLPIGRLVGILLLFVAWECVRHPWTIDASKRVDRRPLSPADRDEVAQFVVELTAPRPSGLHVVRQDRIGQLEFRWRPAQVRPAQRWRVRLLDASYRDLVQLASGVLSRPRWVPAAGAQRRINEWIERSKSPVFAMVEQVRSDGHAAQSTDLYPVPLH